MLRLGGSTRLLRKQGNKEHFTFVKLLFLVSCVSKDKGATLAMPTATNIAKDEVNKEHTTFVNPLPSSFCIKQEQHYQGQQQQETFHLQETPLVLM